MDKSKSHSYVDWLIEHFLDCHIMIEMEGIITNANIEVHDLIDDISIEWGIKGCFV